MLVSATNHPYMAKLQSAFGPLLTLALLLNSFGCQKSSTVDAPVAVQGKDISAPVTPNASPAAPKTPLAPGTKVAPTNPEELAKLAQNAPDPVVKDGYLTTRFSDLSDFKFPVDNKGKLLPGSELPDNIRDLNEKNVAVSGYMVPLDFKDDKVISFILVKNQLLCCYGQEPKLNDWIFAEPKEPVEFVSDLPVTVFGKFYAAPDLEDGQVISLYRMEAHFVEEMP